MGSVLFLRNLSGSFLILVSLHDLILQFLELVGLSADAFDFFCPAGLLDLEASHFSCELVLDLGGLSGHEL